VQTNVSGKIATQQFCQHDTQQFFKRKKHNMIEQQLRLQAGTQMPQFYALTVLEQGM